LGKILKWRGFSPQKNPALLDKWSVKKDNGSSSNPLKSEAQNRMRLKALLASLLFLTGFSPLAFGQAHSHLKVEILQEQMTVQPGAAVTVGFYFRMDRGWHIYWQNPGDSGQAPSIKWDLPEGFTAGDIQWPTPKMITLPSVADYGYTNEVLLMVPLQAPANLKPCRIAHLSANVRWLVCQEICIPGSKPLKLRLSVSRKTPRKSRYAYLFQAARRRLPAALPEDWKVSGSIGSKDFHLSVETGSRFTKATFFPLDPGQVDNAKPQKFLASGNSFHLTVKRSDQLLKDIEELDGVLVVGDKKGEKGYLVNVPLSGS
jgi:DsbC/DsbD-like thiol-disulfide interchange protein